MCDISYNLNNATKSTITPFNHLYSMTKCLGVALLKYYKEEDSVLILTKLKANNVGVRLKSSPALQGYTESRSESFVHISLSEACDPLRREERFREVRPNYDMNETYITDLTVDLSPVNRVKLNSLLSALSKDPHYTVTSVKSEAAFERDCEVLTSNYMNMHTVCVRNRNYLEGLKLIYILEALFYYKHFITGNTKDELISCINDAVMTDVAESCSEDLYSSYCNYCDYLKVEEHLQYLFAVESTAEREWRVFSTFISDDALNIIYRTACNAPNDLVEAIKDMCEVKCIDIHALSSVL